MEYNGSFSQEAETGGRGGAGLGDAAPIFPPMDPYQVQMPGMIPGMMPIMTMPASTEIDYNSWLAENFHRQQYRTAYNEPHTYQDYQDHAYQEYPHPVELDVSAPQTEKRFYADLVDSAQSSLPSSPRYGPGPPIVTSNRVKGPKGCNLFVFHLPNEITNWDLYLLFRKYGTILSVHTMINKSTGLSKGYGFVSYSARDEALAAIGAMDGFRLGKKRLKVQVKRSQDDISDEEVDNDNCGSVSLYEATRCNACDTSSSTIGEDSFTTAAQLSGASSPSFSIRSNNGCSMEVPRTPPSKQRQVRTAGAAAATGSTASTTAPASPATPLTPSGTSSCDSGSARKGVSAQGGGRAFDSFEEDMYRGLSSAGNGRKPPTSPGT